MQVAIPHDLASLATYLPRFLMLVGEARWFRRANHLDAEQHKSPFQWKIVSDYHWLEMAISCQCDILTKEGHLLPALIDEFILAALRFAAMTVEVHARLSRVGQQNLEGRLRDGLKAEAGYAPLYLELECARQLMDEGFDVTFADMEGRERFDLLFNRGLFAGEVECKSLSVDAGRQIHRKDFYRFMEKILPVLEVQRRRCRREVLVVTLNARLSSNSSYQAPLLSAIRSMIEDDQRPALAGRDFELERRDFDSLFAGVSMSDAKALRSACGSVFGSNAHVAGGLSDDGGCLVVMRSLREEDTSKPMLAAMRAAATQLSRQRPSFIAIQEHGIEAAELGLPSVRRRAEILSEALYGHYGASHVNAIYITGFGAVISRNGMSCTPGFSIPNPEPAFPLVGSDALPFLTEIDERA